MSLGYRLEPFTPMHWYKQAHDLKALVSRQGEWLSELFPATDGYRTLPGAFKRIGSAARSAEMSAYVVRLGSVAKGVATVIFDQTLLHPDPEVRAVHGDDLDYWLEPSANDKDHKSVADALLREAEYIHQKRTHKKHRSAERQRLVLSQTLMATKRADYSMPQAEGLYSEMRAIGRPAVLATPYRSMSTEVQRDPLGVTKNGALLQLYTLEFEVTPAEQSP